MATQVSGVKSLMGSNGSVLYRLALMAWLVKLISRVLPSGTALATASAAMLPPAPGRFSTITVRPNRRPISVARVRASVSVDPPAGAPTRMRTGAVCASALELCSTAGTGLSAIRTWRRWIMVGGLLQVFVRVQASACPVFLVLRFRIRWGRNG
ncbi:hypothetical protein D3C72_1915420 [compost metagenome]